MLRGGMVKNNREVAHAFLWACSSVGRAPALQAGCRKFDPCQVHHFGAWNRVAKR